MTETPGAGETEGTRTRGSIARRMLVTAAIWSAVVLVIGVVTSVFTAVTLTRMWVAGWLRRARPSDLNI